MVFGMALELFDFVFVLCLLQFILEFFFCVFERLLVLIMGSPEIFSFLCACVRVAVCLVKSMMKRVISR